jgi:1-acyl-sn-glycerol-3-phosphate acyltransferase
MRSEKVDDSTAPLTRKTAVYRLIRLTCILYLELRHRMRVEGREHLPATGGVLVVANHQSFLDIPILAAVIGRHVCFVARSSLAASPLLAFIMRQCGAVLIDRGGGDRGAMREIGAHLTAGDLVVIYPEGTRTEDGSVGEFKGGVLSIARRAGVPMVPTAIEGSHSIWPRGRRWPGPGRIGVQLLEPVDPRASGALEKVRRAIVEALEGGGGSSGPSR